MNPSPELNAVRGRNLVICLDGTWNTRDSGTSVYHLYSFAAQIHDPAEAVGGWLQLRHYDEGVGTGFLDTISGGAFGFGLDANVRQAYQFLFENYQEGDRVFIFGFSRGAFTARSLTGFLSKCGLLRRGAPLPLDELWQAYQLIGRAREGAVSNWERLLGRKPPPFREINQLKHDWWTSEDGTDDHIRESALPLTDVEQLLCQWSRRIPIQYLGIFDTVGAMGLDALAIPGLRDKMAGFHNTHTTAIVRHCRHALALDENRGSFAHIPFLKFSENQPTTPRKVPRYDVTQRWFPGVHSNIGGGLPENLPALSPLHWILEGARQHGMLVREGTAPQTSPAVPPGEPSWAVSPTSSRETPMLCDSFLAFTGPVWSQMIRGKRHFRRIAPPPETRGPNPSGVSPPEQELRKKARAMSKAADATKPTPRGGYTLQSLGDEIAPEIGQRIENSPDYAPPNLLEYSERLGLLQITEDFQFNSKQVPGKLPCHESLSKKVSHAWCGSGGRGALWLILWAALGAAGLSEFKIAFAIGKPQIAPLWIMLVAALALPLLDWLESYSNHQVALKPDAPRRRAWLDCLYWLRLFGALLFFAGLVNFLIGAVRSGLTAQKWGGAWVSAWEWARFWWPVAAAALGGWILARIVHQFTRGAKPPTLPKSPTQSKPIVKLILATTICVAGIAAVLAALDLLGGIRRQFSPTYTVTVRPDDWPESVRRGGHLLLLALGLFWVRDMFLRWTGEPMTDSRLRSVMPLQLGFTPARIGRVLCRWTQMLVRKPLRGDLVLKETSEADDALARATHRVQSVLRHTLWRDILGFIPAYTLFFLLGLLWLSQDELFSWLHGLDCCHLALWFWIPLIGAVADWIEGIFHLGFLRHTVAEARNTGTLEQPNVGFQRPLNGFACICCSLCVLVKMIAFTFCMGVVVFGLFHEIWELGNAGVAGAGWRGALAIVLGALAALHLAIGLVAYLILLVRPNR